MSDKVLNEQSRAHESRLRGRGLQDRRARMLDAEPLCRICVAEGRTTAAVELDHIVPLHLGGDDIEDNLQPICDEHHKDKTAGEARGRSKSSVWRRKARVTWRGSWPT